LTLPTGQSYNASAKEIAMNHFLLFFNLGPTELIIVLLIMLLIFGGTRLPQLAKGLGESVKNFKKAVNEDDDDDKQSKKTAA
jgi:sec-independent protein translocase protein TatA